MPEIINPIDDRPAYRFDLLDESQAFARLELAGPTARGWRQVTIEERVALCHRMLDAYSDRLESNSGEITRMMGKPKQQARGEE